MNLQVREFGPAGTVVRTRFFIADPRDPAAAGGAGAGGDEEGGGAGKRARLA